MRIYLLITTIFLSLQAWATPVVIVSDIDDTLKIANVKSRAGSVIAALDTTAVFRGMPQLLTAVAQTQQAAVYYLSNASENTMGKRHREFLGNNAFPPGVAILRTNLSGDQHKLVNLREIIRREQPQVLIVLGDNGERDIAFYDTIHVEYPQLRMIQFIRTLYSKRQHADLLSLREGQMAFASPVELYLTFADMGVLPEPAAREAAAREVAAYLQALREPLPRRGPAYRREWMDFSDTLPVISPRQRDIPGLDQYMKSLMVPSFVRAERAG